MSPFKYTYLVCRFNQAAAQVSLQHEIKYLIIEFDID